MHTHRSKLSQVLIGLLLLAFGQVHAQSGIQFFEGKLQAAIDKAAAEDKLVFVDGYAEWCGPCKWMAANAFQDAKVGTFFNHHFVSTQIDLEKGEGPSIAGRFEIRAYPTLLFLDGKGDLHKQSVGAKDADGLLELAQAVVRLAKPELVGKGQPGDPGYVPIDVFTMPDLATAFAKAKAESKMVFVYLTNPYGGVTQPELAKATFSDPQVVQALHDRAVCITIEDVGLTGEEFDSIYPAIAGVNRPIFSPALLFFRADGSLAENWFQDVDAAGFMALLDAAQGDPAQTLASKHARIVAGDHDEALLYDCLLHAKRAGTTDQEALTAFLPALRGKRLLEERSWEIYRRFRTSFDASMRDTLLALMPALIAQYGHDSVVAELRWWRYDEINYFSSTEQADAFDPGIRRLEQVAHLDPQLQIDLAYLRMLRAVFIGTGPKAEQELIRSAHALLDLRCSDVDRDALCFYLQTNLNLSGKPRKRSLLAVLALSERMIAEQPSKHPVLLRIKMLRALKQDEKAKLACEEALKRSDLNEMDRLELQSGGEDE